MQEHTMAGGAVVPAQHRQRPLLRQGNTMALRRKWRSSPLFAKHKKRGACAPLKSIFVVKD